MNFALAYKNSILSYQKKGHGQNPLLLFHGFGQNKQIFDELAHAVDDHYTLYAIDLFFHGNSQWSQGELALEKKEWLEIMIQFLAENKIERFSLLGFSLGGKFALATLELFPSRINQLFLLAPDGIKTNFWYSLATYPLLLRRFFKSMILKPGRLHGLTSFLYRLRLVDKGLLRFAESQMDTQEKRERVYYSWVVFRHLKFVMKDIASLLEKHAIQLTLLVGEHDKIITTENMQQLLRYVKDHQLIVLDTGHNGVIDESIEVLRKLGAET